jgi:mannose-6-phosphate isomerase-like protein (cupin superfamily)
VLEGSVSIGNGTEEVELHLHDSVRLAPGESRQVINRGARTAMVLLVMAYPKA